MNSSQFMDKQIMGLTGSPSITAGGGELFDLMHPQEEHSNSNGGGGGVKRKEELFPSYDFQPIRTVGSSSSSANVNASSDLGPSTVRYSTFMELQEVPKVGYEKERGTYDVSTVSEIDRTVKKYADNLLHALETVSSRLSQLECRTHNLESCVDKLKITVGNNSGSTDGKLRQLENIVREVQTGIQVLRDKQDVVEAQLQLAKLQQSSFKLDHHRNPPSEPSSTTQQPDSQFQFEQHPSPYQPLPPPVASVGQPQQPPPPPTTNGLPPAPPLHQNPPTQFPSQLPQTQLPSLPSLPRDPSYFLPQPQSQPPSQTQPPPQPPHYQLLQYSQPMAPPQPPLPHHVEESVPYMQPPPSQTYSSNTRRPPLAQPPQYYGSSSGQLASFPDGYPYSGSPSHYTSSEMKPSPFANAPSSPGGGGSNSSSSYARLPTAKILPQAVPTGSSSSAPSGARVPIDDVVDKVATMGFSRDQVRATVRKLTENGQSVDLNVVLDKLMNGREMIQPQKGWFSR